MAAKHFFFFPFNSENCVAEVTRISPTMSFIRNYVPSFIWSRIPSFVWATISQSDWVRQAVGSDPKGVYAFTLNQYYNVSKRIGTKFAVDQATHRSIEGSYIQAVAELGKVCKVDDTLYIVGHCSPEQNTLHSPDMKVECKVSKLVAYLHKLPKDFEGKIKIHACGSAGAGTSRNSPFAKLFHDEMRKKGYSKVEIFGYSDNIANFHTLMPNGQVHKHREGETVTNRSKLVKIQ